MNYRNPSLAIPKFSEPAIYQIIVKGELNSLSEDRLKGMQIIKETNNDDQPFSILTGQVSDQAALAGITDALYNMRMIVLSVKLLSGENIKQYIPKT